MKLIKIIGKSQRQDIKPERPNKMALAKVIQLEKKNFACAEAGKGTCEQAECCLRIFCFSCG